MNALQAMRARELRRMRRMRLAAVVWKLGERAFFEFLTELDRDYGIVDLDSRLERYANADPRLLRALGGDRLPPRIIHAVRAPGSGSR
jgi:hypothetical protein